MHLRSHSNAAPLYLGGHCGSPTGCRAADQSPRQRVEMGPWVPSAGGRETVVLPPRALGQVGTLQALTSHLFTGVQLRPLLVRWLSWLKREYTLLQSPGLGLTQVLVQGRSAVITCHVTEGTGSETGVPGQFPVKQTSQGVHAPGGWGPPHTWAVG